MTRSAINPAELTPLDRRLLDEYQRNLPLTAEPFRDIADSLGVDEETILTHLRKLQASRVVSRVGPVFSPNRIGVSTLVAAKVPKRSVNEIAAMISRYPSVNHNYEREHEYNLWFVVTAPNQAQLDRALNDIGHQTGLDLLVLPMLRDYFIDLGFDIQWEPDDVH